MFSLTQHIWPKKCSQTFSFALLSGKVGIEWGELMGLNSLDIFTQTCNLRTWSLPSALSCSAAWRQLLFWLLSLQIQSKLVSKYSWHIPLTFACISTHGFRKILLSLFLLCSNQILLSSFMSFFFPMHKTCPAIFKGNYFEFRKFWKVSQGQVEEISKVRLEEV